MIIALQKTCPTPAFFFFFFFCAVLFKTALIGHPIAALLETAGMGCPITTVQQ